MPCDPLSPPDGGGFQPIRSQLVELSQELGPEDYRGYVVPLTAALGTTLASSKVQFRCPTTHNFVIDTILGHLALVDVFNEVLSVKNGVDTTKGIGDFSAAPDVQGRLLMKAMNVRMTLQNDDVNQALFDSKVGLADILTSVGGRPIDWTAAPHILPAGQTLSMTVELIQSGSSGDVPKLLGGSTEYGLVLIGKLIRVKRS